MSNDRTGMDKAIFPNTDPIHNYYIIPDNCILSDRNISIQSTVMANANIFPQLNAWRNIGKMANCRSRFFLTVKMLYCVKKGPLAFRRTDDIGNRADSRRFCCKGQCNLRKIKMLWNIFGTLNPSKRTRFVVN